MEPHEGVQSYSREEWEKQKSIIEQLYQVKRRSTADVKYALQDRGFHVNERMIKTRVRLWGLDKKHKHEDMRTAVALMARNPSRWATQSPRFRIRGRIVNYPDIQLYFRRKRIADPIAWVKGLRDDGFVASPKVELIGPEPGASAANSSSKPLDEPVAGPTNTDILPSFNGPSEGRSQNSNMQLINSPSRTDQLSILDISIIHPHKHRPGDQSVWATQAYIFSYLESARALDHKEPSVHRFTTHATFAQRMQTGMFSFSKGEALSALSSFEAAFNMTKELFRNDHPMGVAMLMSVICELNKNNLEHIISQLVAHVRQMVAIQNKGPHILDSLFEALEQAGPDAASLAICSMRTALGALAEKEGTLDWKTLYLKERLCDCLYWMGESGVGAVMRSNLLEEQEMKYGKFARNVLWTALNVADDHLQRGEPWKADIKFRDVLDRSEKLEGYERANSRFKALEGLAKTALAAGESLLTAEVAAELNLSAEELRQKKQSIMLETIRLYEQAEEEAATWFEPESTRRVRLTENKQKLLSKIDSTNQRDARRREAERKNSSAKVDLQPWPVAA